MQRIQWWLHRLVRYGMSTAPFKSCLPDVVGAVKVLEADGHARTAGDVKFSGVPTCPSPSSIFAVSSGRNF